MRDAFLRRAHRCLSRILQDAVHAGSHTGGVRLPLQHVQNPFFGCHRNLRNTVAVHVCCRHCQQCAAGPETRQRPSITVASRCTTPSSVPAATSGLPSPSFVLTIYRAAPDCVCLGKISSNRNPENPHRSCSSAARRGKGVAHHYNVVVGEEQNPEAAWHYRDPKDTAAETMDHIAFWNGVEVVESAQGVQPPYQRASSREVPCQISFSLTPI